MAKKNVAPTVQNDGDNPLMDGGENVQNGEAAAAGEDVKNKASGEGQEEGGEEQAAGEHTDSGEEQAAGEHTDSGENQEEGDAAEPEDVPQILTAVYPILYLSHQYKVGDALPASDPDMVEAWLCAGTAVWMPIPQESPRAKPRTAEPGLPGQAVSSEAEDGDNLAGKVPRTNARKR